MMQNMMLMPKTHTHMPRLKHTVSAFPQEQPKSSLPFIFRLHRLFFGVSSASPQERLLNFFAFYFGGISSASPKERLLNFLALYFSSIWLCIPFGTTFEQKTYAALPQERLFVASSCSASPQGRLSSFSLLFLFSLHSMVHAQLLHLHFWGILLLQS